MWCTLQSTTIYSLFLVFIIEVLFYVKVKVLSDVKRYNKKNHVLDYWHRKIRHWHPICLNFSPLIIIDLLFINFGFVFGNNVTSLTLFLIIIQFLNFVSKFSFFDVDSPFSSVLFDNVLGGGIVDVYNPWCPINAHFFFLN